MMTFTNYTQPEGLSIQEDIHLNGPHYSAEKNLQKNDNSLKGFLQHISSSSGKWAEKN